MSPTTGGLAYDHAECLVEAACAGTAIIQISTHATGEAFRTGRLKRILGKFEVDGPSLWAMYPHNRHLTPRVRAFVDFLAEAARDGRLSEPALVARAARRRS